MRRVLCLYLVTVYLLGAVQIFVRRNIQINIVESELQNNFLLPTQDRGQRSLNPAYLNVIYVCHDILAEIRAINNIRKI